MCDAKKYPVKMKFRILILLIFLCFFSNAQQTFRYTEDLRKEMRYKVEGNGYPNRGLKEFKDDLTSLFSQQNICRKLEGLPLAKIFFEVDFNRTGQPSISLFGTTLKANESTLFENIIFDQLNQIVGRFKPAIYSDSILTRTYLVEFYLNNNLEKIIVTRPSFEASVHNRVYSNRCFTLYSRITGIERPHSLFYATEIDPQYKGGINFLKFELNRLLKNGSDIIDTGNWSKDSVDISFIIDRDSRFGMFEDFGVKSNEEHLIIEKLKLLSCYWQAAISGGRPLNCAAKYRFVYKYAAATDDAGQKKVYLTDIKRLIASEEDFL